MTLGKLFPQHEPSRKVPDPVFLGGPVSPEVIFALVQSRESPGGRSIRILDDLYLAIDSPIVDRVIEKQPSQARFLAGMVLWRPGELSEELRRGFGACRTPGPTSSCASRPIPCGKTLSGAASARRMRSRFPAPGVPPPNLTTRSALVVQLGLLAREPGREVLDVLLRELPGEALHDRDCCAGRSCSQSALAPDSRSTARRVSAGGVRRLVAVGAVARGAYLRGFCFAGLGISFGVDGSGDAESTPR